ncbi:MAG: preprotein translocase subunit YajC [Natronospirillum sp.]
MKAFLSVIALLALAAPGTAFAAAAGSPSPIPSFIMLGLFVLIFYFMLWRPQAKKQKAHRALMESLSKGDEIITIGGVAGKITKVSDDFVVAEVAEGVELKFQRSAVSATLVKGTLKQL